MENINNVIICGNLVADCEKHGSDDNPIVNFTIAFNENRKNKEGNWEDYTSFIDNTIFGKRAKSLAPYLVKGTKVCVSGKLRQSRWENDGQKNSKVSIIVNTLEFMSKANKDSKQESIPFDGEPW